MNLPVLLLLLTAAGDASPALVAGTSHLLDIVQALSGEGAAPVQTLLPPTMCPGHFDVKPGDIAAIKDARIVLLHDWQQPMANIRALLKAAEAPAAEAPVAETPVAETPPGKVQWISAPGNWLSPPTQVKAVEAVADALARRDAPRADQYKVRAAARIKTVEQAGADVRGKLTAAGCDGLKILCHDKLAPFLEWAGFVVVGTYGRDGELSAAGMQRLLDGARRAGVVLIVDNLQGGAFSIAAALARDTRAAHVILSNFPGGFPGVDTWEQTLRKDAQLLVQAATERRAK